RTARCWVAADRADGRSMPFQTQVVADKSGNYPFIGENPFSESSMGYAMGFRLWRRRPTRNSPWQILPPFGWICSAGEMTRTKLRAPRDPNAAASAKFHHLLGYGQFFRWRNGFRPNYRHPLPSHKLYAESRNSKFRARSVLLCCRGGGVPDRQHRRKAAASTCRAGASAVFVPVPGRRCGGRGSASG